MVINGGGDDHQGAGGDPEKPGATRGPCKKQEERRQMKTPIRAIAIIAAFITTPAAAADLYRKAPAFAAAPFNGYNWNGAYVGVNLGYQWGKVSNWANVEPNGIMGGGQVGYNWQYGQFVFGAEADLQGSGANDTFAAFKFSNPWFGTVRGRAGYAMNNVLIYGTGGLAYGGGRVDVGAFNESQTHLGWTLGGGVEVGLTPNWTARAEYLYVRLEDQPYVLTGAQNGFQSNVFRLGVNYRF
jgi:outer membrane immunogenic protein